ncbi:lantibiotic dehydratase [Streptomyces sp. NK08204]|uniref:lantibiotic dehydratase n=1 Tax=Streptomyces sp. NK08204 TaxID=2873260 RepID=UPI001CECB936|nr:lantibiotic dehydratase [Streptomyces sp. NK08204]
MTEDHIPLGESRWRLWKGAVLRGAGFPWQVVEAVADPALAQAADLLNKDTSAKGRRRPEEGRATEYADRFAAAADRVAGVVAGLTRDPRFREAVTWQNRAFVHTCLDRESAGAHRDAKARKRESSIVAYAQRYATKNESIGFFGPVGWADWAPSVEHTSVTPGEDLLGRRTVYFETWAIDRVAREFAARPELLPGLPPRPVPANLVRGDEVLRPTGAPVPLAPLEAAVLGRCDGVRTVREIAAALDLPEQRVAEVVRELERKHVLCLDLGGPLETHPEVRLRERLTRIPDAPARRAALRDLDALTAARDTVAAGAGDPERLADALAGLDGVFESLTGESATRLHGQTYAGRTLVYEDTTREVHAEFGAGVLRELAGPLALVLDSGRWLAARIGELYLDRFDAYLTRKQTRTGQDWVPLASLLALATRDLYTGAGTPALAAEATADLQQRWATILAVPKGVRRHEVATETIADAVRETFASAAPPWAGARHHSPDVMVAAESVAALNRGEFQLVLGELHLAYNTVEARALVEQSPDPARLLALAERAAGAERIMLAAPRSWGAVTSRTSPPSALLSPRWRYWALGEDDVCHLPGEVLPTAALEVGRCAEGLVVRHLPDGRTFPLAEVLGEYLSAVTVNAFRMLPRGRHTPRVSIGRLTVARETWRLPARRFDWAFQLDERTRYLQMRDFVARHGLPERVFCSVPLEMKPVFVDFSSIPLTNALAGLVRRTAREGGGDITVSEMLPDADALWLTDRSGAAYTSELRTVVFDDDHH